MLLSRRYIVGLGLLVIVNVIWSVASLIVADAEESGADPFFITFFCNALFALYLPLSEKNAEAGSAMYISPLWMLANASYNVSLGLTSITSSTILSTTSSLWALFFGLRWNVEGKRSRGLTQKKILGATLSIAGSTFAALGDSTGGGPKESILGDIMALLSAFAYGLYGSALRATNQYEKFPFRFFGMVGVWNFIFFLGPMIAYFTVVLVKKSDWRLVLAQKTGFHDGNGRDFGLITAKGLFDNVLSDFLWAQAVIRTTPTVATVGMSLTVPLAFLIDAFITKDLPTDSRSLGLQLAGAILVLLGFLLTAFSSADDDDDDKPAPLETGPDTIVISPADKRRLKKKHPENLEPFNVGLFSAGASSADGLLDDDDDDDDDLSSPSEETSTMDSHSEETPSPFLANKGPREMAAAQKNPLHSSS